MKCLLVLSVFVLAAIGAPARRPVPSACPDPNGDCFLLPASFLVWLDSTYGPPDTIYGDTTTISTGAYIYASRYLPDTRVEIDLWKDSVLDSTETRTYNLNPPESVLIDFTFSVKGNPEYAGHYAVRDSILDDQPTDSEHVTWRFWILPFQSIDEGRRQQAPGRELLPAVLRRLPAGAIELDAMGRRVLNPKPGVYFVRAGALARTEKVILVR